jgi:hypothetical protein
MGKGRRTLTILFVVVGVAVGGEEGESDGEEGGEWEVRVRQYLRWEGVR